MKSFKDYLIESKQTYDFKIKLVGDHSKEAADKIKLALSKFNVESISEPKGTPIQETQMDFPSHNNVSVTIFDVGLSYPATKLEIQSFISNALNLAEDCVKVRSDADEKEEELNNAYAEKSGKAILGTDYEKENNQDLVGDKHVMGLLKELSKTKHAGEQYKGVNDQILAKKAPKEKTTSAKVDKKSGTVSTIGSKVIDKPAASDIGK